MWKPCAGKTEYGPGRIQHGRRLAMQVMPYGLPPCVVRGLLRRRAEQLPDRVCSLTRFSPSEEPVQNLLRRLI